MKKKRVITGIDVGTTKICVVLVQTDGDTYQVLGKGWSPSRGMKKGVVVNLSEAIDGIKAALEQAEQSSQTVVESAFVSVGGVYTRGVNSAGRTEVRNRTGEITQDDISRAVAEARSFELPREYEIIHVLTRSFQVDGQEGIVNPLGMSGKQLAVRLHVVLNASAIVQNIVNAVNKAGVVVEAVVMQQLASAEAVLTADEKELGAIVVDIGGGTTDVAVYSHGSISHSEVLPLGADLITKDLAIGLKVPLQEAEQLKKTQASVFPESVPEEEVLEVTKVGTGSRQAVQRQRICEIVQARGEEMLASVAEALNRIKLSRELLTGVVLTGGGALLDGLCNRAEQIFDMPVRIGYPANVVGSSEETFHPAYSTVLGLVKYTQELRNEATEQAAKTALSSRPRLSTEKMKNWILARIG